MEKEMSERLKLIVGLQSGSEDMKGLTRLYKASGKFLWLAKETGILASAWENAYHGRQRIRQDMVMWIGRLYPELIYWLVTGVEDVEAGHLSVSTYKARNGQDDASVAYLRALSSDKATPEEKEALRAERADAICEARGRNPLA
jgi:hypothetical protein